MDLRKSELELIKVLRSGPISEIESFLEIFNIGLSKAMDKEGVGAIDDWKFLSVTNISGPIEDILCYS